MKQWLYGIVVACFAVAGVLDIRAGETQTGVAALLLAATNAVIFLWRP